MANGSKSSAPGGHRARHGAPYGDPYPQNPLENPPPAGPGRRAGPALPRCPRRFPPTRECRT